MAIGALPCTRFPASATHAVHKSLVTFTVNAAACDVKMTRSVAVVLLLSVALAAKDPADCEVCIKALNDISAKLTPADLQKDLPSIEANIGKYCAKPPGEKEGKLCYYLDPIKREISQPLKNKVPVEKICERLKKKSAEICSLRFSTMAPVKAADVTDFNKLRIKDLKTLMAEKGIECKDCIEKADFVRKLESVLGKPAAAAAGAAKTEL